MELRTEIQIPESPFKIDHHQKIYLTGSCFSESILDKFRYFGFNALANSHGIIYNPQSISKSFDDIIEKKKYVETDLQIHNGNYFSYAHHGQFSASNPQTVLDGINSNIETHHSFLSRAKTIFITLGTAWIYVNEGKTVANCHKMPASCFTKLCMSLTDIGDHIEGMISKIKRFNPLASIVFTVSPVKHLKDGFVENQHSKSILHLAIMEQRDDKVFYFPSYEIMNDDLRDYRFWKEDMVHPNELAIEYIWQKLSRTYFNGATIQLMDEVKKLRQFLDHRPLTNDQIKIDEREKEKEKRKQEFLYKYPLINL